jgi:hypothetical protein
MEERLEKLEEAVKALEAAVTGQGRRIDAIESGKVKGREADDGEAGSIKAGAPAPDPRADEWALSAIKGTPALVGRSLLVLAGAFLLRAFTEAEWWATGTGVTLGLAYAASWIVATALAARKGARASAGFFGVCAALIAGPLIFEASTEFGVLSPTGSAVMLAMMTAAGLVVASRWRLPESAWVFVLGAMVTGAGLAVGHPPGEAATAVLVAVGLAVAWSTGLHRWESLRWMTAVGADVGVLRLTAMATVPGGPHGIDPPDVILVVVLQGALLLGYTGSSFARAVRGRHQIRTFDYLQTALVWAIGWGGTIELADFHGIGTWGLAAFALLVGLIFYVMAFFVMESRQGGNQSFLFLSSFGLALVLLGLAETLGSASSVAWAVLALIAAAAGSRWNRLVLRVHAVVLLLAAWISSGVVTELVGDLGGQSRLEAIPNVGAILVALLTVLTALVLLFDRRREESGWMERLPLTVLLVMSGLVLASAMVSVAELVAPNAAVWMGTVALCVMTILCAVLAWRWGVREAGWLVYPLLAVTGLRIVLVDLASGRTVVFVIVLAAYGAALITSPKILRSRRYSTET